MSNTSIPDRVPRAVIGTIALVELLGGMLGLRATVVHADAYPTTVQWSIDIMLFSALVLTALGLLRRRRWALEVTRFLLYGAFIGVLALLSALYAKQHTQWWYWAIPGLLPIIGWAVYVLRTQRAAFSRRW